MPHCHDSRWHATQDEADACMKYPEDKDFDNLSTISRRERVPQTRTPPSTPPIDNPGLPAAPTMDDEQNTTQPSADDDQDDLPQTPHTPTVPDGTVQTGQPIPDWLDNIPSNPGSVARTGLTVTETGMLHTPVTPGTKTRYGESDQDQHTTHGDGIGPGLDDATIRQIAKTFGPSVRTPTDSQEGPNIIKPDHLNPENSAANCLPWLAAGDIRAISRALFWAMLCAVLLFGLVLSLAGQDAEKFP